MFICGAVKKTLTNFLRSDQTVYVTESARNQLGYLHLFLFILPNYLHITLA